MAAARQMQMLVTRFERLSRRISLAGLTSNHKAVEAIAAGRVKVDGRVATTNFKVFQQAHVTLDGLTVPPPDPEPKLWAMFKPRKVICENVEREGMESLRSRMRRWGEKEMKRAGKAGGVGLEEENLQDKHWVIVTGLPYAFDGLVLLTNDGIFAETLASAESNVLSAFDCKVQGDPPVELLHKWRTGARAAGVNYGRVFCSVTKRTGATFRLRVRYVESPDRPVDMLLDSHRMRVQTVRRHSFGPYIVTDVACLHVDALAELREAKIVLASGLPNYLVFRRR
ncbi:unnamed protein product [Effrenium voratum]|nr:unnamed protein product [Effrenium voratum]